MTQLDRQAFDKVSVAKTYGFWAPVYDLVFGEVFAHGRAAAVEAAQRVGGRVLEVGVGTGISLPIYSTRTRVVGVDLSAAMLRKARARVKEERLTQVEGLAVMDAEHLAFADGSFDVVVAQYVITTVPNPEATLDEFARVLRPGGEIILINHIGAERGARAALEHAVAPVARLLGWRPEFRWSRLSCWAERHGRIGLIERRPMPPFGHFDLIRFGKRL